QRQGVRVPASALRRSLVGEDEVVVCGGDAAHISKGTIGNRSEQGVEIKDGLKPGQHVVVDHVLGLQGHQPLDARRRAPAARAGDDNADDDEADQPARPKAKAAKTTESDTTDEKTGDKPAAEPGKKGSDEK